jgi:tripartite-type tricarboxylate transporter receptor subunit TctC
MPMKLPRRQFLHLAAGAAALPVVSRIARAQAYPTRPVRIIVGYAPAGATDIAARLIGQWLSERLGRPVVIENRPGAGSNIGTEVVARAPADGYTLLLVTKANAINTTFYERLNFNFIRDIAPVAGISHEPQVLVLNPSVPANTVAEFIAYAKSNSGKTNMASGTIGTTPHLTNELFKSMTGIDVQLVPYRSGGEMITALLGGQAEAMFVSLSSSIETIRSRKLRALAVTTLVRSDALPNVPTVDEFVKGFEASNWYGIAAPRNTPADIINRLNKEINASLADPRLKARLADLGATPMPMTPADFGKLIADETEKWGKVIRAANIKAE